MKAFLLLIAFLLIQCCCLYGQNEIHVWQKVDIELRAGKEYENPYSEVDVWVDLKGPGFDRRCYGFWDGNNIWRIRVMATGPGKWSWSSGSNQDDDGLDGKSGSFQANEWSETDKQCNPLRRGMIRHTTNGHAFEYKDGTPMFWLADTWWSCMTQRYAWYDDEVRRKVGTPDAGFKDYVRFRKAQGFNGCMVVAAFPNWDAENSAWGGSNWEDEAGNRAFLGPATSPDLNRINPAYFQSMDKKVDHLNANGFIPFIETARRDIASYWKSGFGWPESYARYIRYIWFRYQGNIVINSPIHLDGMALSGEEWNQAANIIKDRYDWAPFGHQASANPPGSNADPNGSTLNAFGHTDQAKWLTFHSVGNCRNHELFPRLTDAFFRRNYVPCLNNEPYYDGLMWGDTAKLGTDEAAYYCRVALYGSVLSGALAGHVYGANHIWDGDIDMPKAFLVQSAFQMQHILKFLFSEGMKYQELLPIKELLIPNQTANEDKNMGWAYCMRTSDQSLFLLYFEKKCRNATLRGARPNSTYTIRWFDTIDGKWESTQEVLSDEEGKITLPDFPGRVSISERDWAVKLNEIRRDIRP